MVKYEKGERLGAGILTYVGKPPLQVHECKPPPKLSDDIPLGSVWWCLDCDWQWVKERSGWAKWRKAP